MKFRVLRDLFHLSAPHSVLVFILLTFISSTPAQETSKEVRRSIKEAAKLTRNESLREAEAILRQAVELDPASSEAKVELAYVLVKQHRLRAAYDLCFPV